MVQEILDQFEMLKSEVRGSQREQSARAELSYLDATFGRGGHFEKIVAHPEVTRAVGLDRDEDAIEFARLKFQGPQYGFACERFSRFSSDKHGLFDFILVDLGVSSPQLEDPTRGFSFYHGGPLDMRMGRTQEYSAAEVINTFTEEELVQIFQKYGEIHQPFRLVQSLLARRKEKPFTETQDLAVFMEKIWGWRKKGEHPATHVFRALRLFVNQELEEVEHGIPQLMTGLKPQGRLAVLTFHSLEDRLVKEIFKSQTALGSVVNKKVIKPTRAEILKNPRSRSAFLRVFQKG